jgi:hypothetical protein
MDRNKTQLILKRIHAKGRGWVFTPKHFLDLASRNVVDQVLFRLSRQGTIRKIDRGVYDFPKQSAKLGILSPDPDHIAQALAAQKGNTLQPSGALSANLLGLTTQVPGKRVYLTNGKSSKKQVGAFLITFKHTPIQIPAKGKALHAAAALQALLYLGRDGIDNVVIDQCRRHLSAQDKQQLLGLAPQSPGWVAKHLQQIVA